MSLSFRAKRAAHVSRVDMDHDMSARAMRVRGNVHIDEIGDVGDAAYASGSSDKLRIRIFDARVSDVPSLACRNRLQAKSSTRLTSLELSLVL